MARKRNAEYLRRRNERRRLRRLVDPVYREHQRERERLKYARYRSHQPSRRCVVCNAAIAPHPGRGRWAKFCSQKCRPPKPKPSKVYPPIACSECGKQFTPKYYNSKACSPDCKKARRLKQSYFQPRDYRRERAHKEALLIEREAAILVVKMLSPEKPLPPRINRRKPVDPEIERQRNHDYYRWKNPLRVVSCRLCGTEFKTGVMGPKAYCSSYCRKRQAYLVATRKMKSLPREQWHQVDSYRPLPEPKPKLLRTCVECGKQFNLSHHARLTCSFICKREQRNRTHKLNRNKERERARKKALLLERKAAVLAVETLLAARYNET